ncbi:MAG: hypothetical protein N2Z74_02035, partial [Syntrophales bacterium]|nr:hypothetical protein [Syntrophales bacterium]
MVGLPGDDGGAWQRTVEKVVALRPEMVRIHPTLVLRDTPLAAAWRADTYRPLSLEAAVAACKMAVRRFREAGIAVIRLGLHETREMGEPGAVLAGPRHPAFGDLVLSALWRDEAVRLLTGRQLRGKVVTFTVPPRNMSIFRGQGNANIHFLKARFGLADLHIVPGPTLALQEVRDGA